MQLCAEGQSVCARGQVSFEGMTQGAGCPCLSAELGPGSRPPLFRGFQTDSLGFPRTPSAAGGWAGGWAGEHRASGQEDAPRSHPLAPETLPHSSPIPVRLLALVSPPLQSPPGSGETLSVCSWGIASFALIHSLTSSGSSLGTLPGPCLLSETE